MSETIITAIVGAVVVVVFLVIFGFSLLMTQSGDKTSRFRYEQCRIIRTAEYRADCLLNKTVWSNNPKVAIAQACEWKSTDIRDCIAAGLAALEDKKVTVSHGGK